MRIITPSTTPPKKPATIPYNVPTKIVIMPANIP